MAGTCALILLLNILLTILYNLNQQFHTSREFTSNGNLEEIGAQLAHSNCLTF